ncbi:YwmB family TATA-box binding protein [Ornithinibacillus sp. 179-J 7C1 HS]|uniref:YwmB family TATA-box binding protein n=1 Tax=Ornithinibacillus sp. 179-J 7C1 HS TaxID=3142384 RepID=UPI00399F1360
MKRALAICLMILCITNTALAKQLHQNELVDIANFMLQNDLKIDGWEVTMKEYIETNELQEIVKGLSTSHTVTRQENKNSIIYLVKDTHKKGTINVKYNVIFPKDKRYKSELVVVINGNSWTPDVEATYNKLVSSYTGKYFSKNVKIFSCMTTRADAIIEKDDIVDNFTKNFKLHYKKTQYDTLKSTKNVEYIYGYTSLWGQKIAIQDKPVNVQFVTKTLASGDVQFTIGTPILINEY